MRSQKMATHSGKKLSRGMLDFQNTSLLKLKQANDRLFTAPKTEKGDIGDLLSATHANNKEQSKTFLLKILQNIRFLARQSLAFRGNWSYKEKNEEDSNDYQLLKLRCEDDAELTKCKVLTASPHQRFKMKCWK